MLHFSPSRSTHFSQIFHMLLGHQIFTLKLNFNIYFLQMQYALATIEYIIIHFCNEKFLPFLRLMPLLH